MGKPRVLDWKSIQCYHDAGHTRIECMKRFDLGGSTWFRAAKEKRLIVHKPGPVLIEKLKSRGSIKKHLLKRGVLEYKCGSCGLSEWQGKPISLQLEHKNGIKTDNRVENLCLLCPNCHSQTETFAGRNVRRLRIPADIRELF